MPEQIPEVPQPTSPAQPVPVEPKKKSNLPLIVILLIVISLIAVGVVLGMQIGKRQVAGGLSTKATPTPIPQPTVTPAPDATVYTEQSRSANWKTYRNEKYGFEIMYPPNWQVKQEFSYQDGFFITNNQDKSRVAIFPNGEFDYGLPGDEPEISNITLAGRNAEQTLFNNSKIKLIKILNLPLNWSNNNRVDINFTTQKETIDQILSTFKFTN